MPTQTSEENVTLYYRDAGSDKVYQAAVESSGNGFVVTFAYGRRGSTLTTGAKTAAIGFRSSARQTIRMA